MTASRVGASVVLLSTLLVACCRTAPPGVVRADPSGLEKQQAIVREAFAGTDIHGDAEAAASFARGRRESVSAAWWGFDPEDATSSLQASLDSGARIVVVPAMGRPWITRPLSIRSGTTLVLEEGVELITKKGDFRRNDAALFLLKDVEDVVILGYGARCAMRKEDYRRGPYEKSEWRHAVEIDGCARVLVAGILAESSGGDGVYIGRGDRHTWCSDVELRDLVLHNHYRQGISVISAQGLLVENVEMSFTEGTPPGSGIDFEPNNADERLFRCVLRNCVIHSNQGPAIAVVLSKLDRDSTAVDIQVEDSWVSGSPVSFLVWGDSQAGGAVRFARTKLLGIQVIQPGHRLHLVGN
jgi:Right handed beta helix region